MKIKADNFDLTLSYDELWNIAFWIKHSLESTLKTHWVNHQDAWQKNEKAKLKTLKEMFTVLNELYLYDQIFIDAESIFKVHNENKKQ